MRRAESLERARALLVREFFSTGSSRFVAANRRRRDAIRGETLLDAPSTDLSFSMDDYRDVCLHDAREALAWMRGRAAPRNPSAPRLAAVEAALAVLHQRPPQKGRSVSSALAATVLETWPRPEILRVAALLFETGLLRDPAQLDGALWYSEKRSRLRIHVPTVAQLFPGLDLDDPAHAAVRAPRA